MPDAHSAGSRHAENSHEQDLLRELLAARKALVYYRQGRNWSDDDWGIKAVHREYGEAGRRASKAVERIDRAIGRLY
jgi:hypothetical protein